MHEESKKSFRQSLIEKRKSLRDHLLSYAPFEQLLHTRILMAIEKIDTIYSTKINKVGFYWPIQGELDLRPPLLHWQKQREGRQLALPVTQQNHALSFYRWDENTVMKAGYAKIPEPVTEDVLIPELIICPCVGWYFFHHQLWRIGYGGGFYDRTMQAFENSAIKPFLLGIALDQLQVCDPRWQPQAHDFPLQGLLTESSLYLLP